MSYVLADATGVLSSFASIGGLADFRDWAVTQPAAIRSFVARGWTEDLAELHAALEKTTPPAKVKAQVETLLIHTEDAEEILIISDEAGAEDAVRALGRRSEGPLHAAADQHVAKLNLAVRYAFAAARKAMAKAVAAGKPVKQASALAIVVLRDELRDSLPGRLREAYLAGGETGAEMLAGARALEDFRAAKRSTPKVGFAFNAKTEEAVSWADRHAAELITNISETSREAINNAVAEFLEDGEWDEYHDEVLAAVGDERRADVIARNESMVAVHNGQREAWNQAAEAGLLTGDEERVWIVVGDEKVCPICEGLEDKTAPLDGVYKGDDGNEYGGPPAHVLCRCSEGITGSRSLGDFEGHPFRGNQWTAEGGSIPVRERAPLTAYHGTAAAALQSIKERGLVPAGGKGGDAWAEKNMPGRFAEMSIDVDGTRRASVFLGTDPDYVRAYAKYASDMNPGSAAIVLRVTVPGSERDKIIRDEHDRDAIRFRGAIPPEWIDVMYPGGDTRALEAKRDEPATFYALLLVDEKES